MDAVDYIATDEPVLAEWYERRRAERRPALLAGLRGFDYTPDPDGRARGLLALGLVA